MAILNKLINARAKVFDVQRNLFFPADVTLELLEVSDTTNGFTVIETIDTGWYLTYSEFRNAFRLSVARNDDDFIEITKKVSHARVGDEVYTVRAADTITPQGSNPVYQFICDREFRRSNFRNAY